MSNKGTILLMADELVGTNKNITIKAMYRLAGVEVSSYYTLGNRRIFPSSIQIKIAITLFHKLINKLLLILYLIFFIPPFFFPIPFKK